MSLRRKGITAAKWSTLATLMTTVIQLIQLILMSRLLSPTDYGLVSMTMVVVGMAVSMSDFGVSGAIIHRQQVSREELSSLYLLNLATGAGLGAVVWLAAPLACAYFQEPRLLEPMRWMALLCVIPAIGQQFQVLFQKELRFDYLAKTDVASVIAGFAVALAGALAGFGVYALVGAHLANALCRALCLVVAGWKEWRPQLHFARRDLRGYIRFGAYQTGANVIQTFASNIDYVILGRLVGTEGLGYYSFAYQLGLMPMQKLWPLVSQIALPLLAKLQDRPRMLRQAYYQITGALGYATGPIYLGLAAIAPYLVPFAFGGQWTASIVPLQILAIMFLLRGALLPTQSLVLAVGRADKRFYYALYCLAITSACLMAGAWAGGVLGAAWGYLVAQAAIVVVNYLQSIRPVLGHSTLEYVRSFAPGVLYSGLMALIVSMAEWVMRERISGSLLVLCALMIGVAVYGSLLLLFGRRQIAGLLVGMRSGKEEQSVVEQSVV
jgi:O-antigen/teichoic acid export membrane protein